MASRKIHLMAHQNNQPSAICSPRLVVRPKWVRPPGLVSGAASVVGLEGLSASSARYEMDGVRMSEGCAEGV